jgi:cytochrome c oxidase assembly protein Cox11
MPVFFYIDPEFAEDPNLMDVSFFSKGRSTASAFIGHWVAQISLHFNSSHLQIDDITLSYTFFKAREGANA